VSDIVKNKEEEEKRFLKILLVLLLLLFRIVGRIYVLIDSQ
jgi:hypothetical protein